jgi:hypothetical protein
MPSLLSLRNLESLGRGSVAGLLDLPYFFEGMLMGDQDPRMPQRGRVVPSSEQVLATTPRMTQPTPQAGLLETAGAFMSPVPVAAVKPVAQAVGKAIRATEGLPVGMSIKDVGKSSITREGNPIQGAVVLVGDKIFMGRTHGDALNRAVYEGAVRKEGGKYIYPKGAEVNSDLFMTKDGQIIDRLQASKMFDIGASETAIEKGLMQNNPPKSMTVDSYIEQATALKKQREQSPYPQQAALDLAQQRAALPVDQGGLGLPANNTAMDRAKAMGFDVNNPLYHATDVDFASIRPSLQGKLGAGVYVSPSSQYAEKYTSLNAAGNARVLPLVARGKLADDDVVMNIAESIRQEMATQNPNFSVSEWKKRTTQALADAGYDGRNMSGLESVITNPDNLRSRFAAFDPFRRTAATAAAMGVAAPDLLAAEPTPEELQRRQSASLLFP